MSSWTLHMHVNWNVKDTSELQTEHMLQIDIFDNITAVITVLQLGF